MNEKLPIPEDINRDVLISRLTATDTPLEERISLTRELFPEELKREKLATADKDSKGRPVRYFRYISYQELKAILDHTCDRPLENSQTDQIFQERSEDIKYVLIDLLEREKIYELFEVDFKNLQKNFTLENYRKFVQCKLPRIILFKLHIGFTGSQYPGVTGLKSLSVGAPVMPPCDPDEYQEGRPVVEFSIPANDVIVHPIGKEMEKEVNTLDLKPEWITDIYNGTQDFAKRFIKDQSSVLNPKYRERKNDLFYDYISERDVWDILQSWKTENFIADLIPVNKLPEIDGKNPNLQRPLLEE